MNTTNSKSTQPETGQWGGGGASGNTARIPTRWRWHYRVLQDLREKLVEDRASQLELAREPLEPHSMDFADSGTDEFDHDMALALLSQQQDALLEVSAAMCRILDGTYGRCEETGQPIPDDRLRAVPWTRHTREVAARLEREGVAPAAHLPAVVSIQGEGAGGLAQVEDPELEDGQAQLTARHQREAAAEAVERGAEEEEEEGFPVPLPVKEETPP